MENSIKKEIISKIENKKSEKNFLITLFLSVFLGFFGAHRFYVNKIGTGLIYFFTIGLFGIGYFTDIILILAQAFEDKDNLKINL